MQKGALGPEFVELRSLGIAIKENMTDREELAELANMIKECLFEDYELAYSENGEFFTEEARATLMP